ncbi:phosphotransferase family protein [Teratosphaeria destructans]|uniref:Phosphotransferase family protein n=1 Tax=Teratosphaeria destructans TaxID=418781 RepID=A0A9W7SQW5_9PEZI|nr:phosphotransferase family protein [Teratosphaeria destructans]
MNLIRCLFRLRQQKTVDWSQNADFFNFTRGRFVCREAEEMARRHIKFDMNELCRAAGAAVGRTCVGVEKCAEGMYSKAFLLTMDNDEQVVAKVPNPNAGPPHLTTASEVATMDFVRVPPSWCPNTD